MKTILSYEGQVCQFLYNGGSNPGSLRRVYIHSTDEHTIYCWDFDYGWRNFSVDKIVFDRKTQIEGSFCFKLPDFLIDSTREKLEDEGYHCFFDTAKKVLAACPPKKSGYVVDVRGNYTGVCIDFTHTSGPTINLVFKDGGGLIVDGQSAEVPQMVAALAQFVKMSEPS